MSREPVSKGQETRSALEAVLADQAERRLREEQGQARAGARRGRWVSLSAVVLAGATAWIVLARPSFLTPSPLPAPSPALLDAGLRMDMYVAAAGIEEYHRATGRLPARLEDALEHPADGEGLSYRILSSDEYELVGVRGNRRIVHRSTDGLSGLIADARRVLMPTGL